MAVAKSDLKNMSMRELVVIDLTLYFGIGFGYHTEWLSQRIGFLPPSSSHLFSLN
jgi:hypothetical protein